MAVHPRLMALGSLASAPFAGTVYRAVREELREHLLSTEGNRFFPGRYHLVGGTGVLYTSLKPTLARAELGRHADPEMLKEAVVVGAVKVRLQRVVDLTRPSILKTLGLSEAGLIAQNHPLTQAIGALARQAGLQGLVVPSATGEGANLVIFEDNLGEGCSLDIIEIR